MSGIGAQKGGPDDYLNLQYSSTRVVPMFASLTQIGGRIGVEDYLIAVPVALGDVSNVQNARCMTTTLDLEDTVISSLIVSE